MQITVHIKRQELVLHDNMSSKTYLISTAANGIGQQNASYQTPLGKHIIRACIGEGMPTHAVFIGRRFTGEIYSSTLRDQHPERKDWILSRIMWLSGLEPGFNRLGNVDTMRRFIYIHGSPDEAVMGKPGSRGCIRMTNHDVIHLFSQIKPRIPITITND